MGHDRSVVVEHVEGADWALVLTANRSEYGRRYIVPMIFCNDGCGIFATAPNLKSWQRAGLVFVYNPPQDRREEMLKNAVAEFVRTMSHRSEIVERSRVGIVARAKASKQDFNNPPEGFALSEASEPALFWLCSRNETAVQAMRVLRYLIGKHKIGALTQAESEEINRKLILSGGPMSKLFDKLFKPWPALRKATPSIFTINRTNDYTELPQGFFRVLTASEEIAGLQRPVLCWEVGPTVVDGGKRSLSTYRWRNCRW